MHEEQVITALRARENGATELLLRYYGPLLRYVIAPILSDSREREECLADAAMQVWEKIGRYDAERGSWKSWLTALTRNLALNRLRREKGTEESLDENVVSPAPGPEERVLHRERLERLNRALLALPPEERALCYRKYYYMQSTRQIAAELGLSERSVEGRLYRIKKKLRLELGGADDA